LEARCRDDAPLKLIPAHLQPPRLVCVKDHDDMNKNAQFPLSRWTLVKHARDPHHPRAREALEELLKLYWYPIYAHLRRRGFSHHEAEDSVQGFLAFACEQRTLVKAEETKGRFRTFVLKCLNNFLNSAHRHRAAAKRGGSVEHFSRDDENLLPEQRYAAEPVDDLSPDRLFERKLAQAILDDSFRELEVETAAGGLSEVFTALRGYLNREEDIEGYRALSARLGLSVSDLKSKTFRFRRRYREIILERARDLVDSEADLKAEMIVLEDSMPRRQGNQSNGPR